MTAEDLAQRLCDTHLVMLRAESGISDAVILARGYRTIQDTKDPALADFAPAQRRAPGLLLPLWSTDGQNPLNVYRPDIPRTYDDKRKRKNTDGTYPQRVIKYELPKGEGSRLDCPPTCRPELGNPKTPLWITEGQKKADALASLGFCAVALLGVWNWKGRNDFGGVTLLADFDHIALNGRDVRIVFDSDVIRKREVKQALERLTEHLQRKGARVVAVYLPAGEKGAKTGVDDYLGAGHTAQELEALIEAPRPLPQPAPVTVRLLAEAPKSLSRPLALVDGQAYAVAWLWTEVTRTESVDRQGNIVRHTPPLVTTEQRRFIVAADGVVYGEGHDKPAEDLGLVVHLDEIPPPEVTWTAGGVVDYRAGRRADPVGVFRRLVEVIDRFMDFNRSLADQKTMAEMVAAYVLATWFLDSFSTIGFLWPTGDRGSGKTQLIALVARLSYLGAFITAGGSFPSLRDLADYGATLAFDDAENLADAKTTDPDKRTLLLAGNRRGNTIPLKELGPDNRWRTRYVNTFCPRLFSATRLPDPILASRTIVIPLIRTPDRRRANADPEDLTLWPHDRRRLIDDLWALALCHLSEMAQFERAVNDHATLTGRNLEPWRALLAVARWLDSKDNSGLLRREMAQETGEVAQNGTGYKDTGLWDRLNGLSVRYQEERPDLETVDITALSIRALCHCAISANRANIGMTHPLEKKWTFTTALVKGAILEDIGEEDAKPETITPHRVGRALGKMRLRQVPRAGGRGSRQWEVTLDDLGRWTTTYGLKLPEELEKLKESGTVGGIPDINGPNGTIGTMAQNAVGEALEVGEI